MSQNGSLLFWQVLVRHHCITCTVSLLSTIPPLKNALYFTSMSFPRNLFFNLLLNYPLWVVPSVLYDIYKPAVRIEPEPTVDLCEKYSFCNRFDPDSDDFFRDAEYEAFRSSNANRESSSVKFLPTKITVMQFVMSLPISIVVGVKVKIHGNRPPSTFTASFQSDQRQ